MAGATPVISVLLGGSAVAQTAPAVSIPDLALGSLKSVKPQEPNLDAYIQDKSVAIALGKAFFWDQQMGSDGVTACATCHFQAGADVRSKNALNPGANAGDSKFQIGGPNYQLTAKDFPLHHLSDPNTAGSAPISDTNDIVGSQGVFGRDFKLPGAPGTLTKGQDICTPVKDPVFSVNGINVRRVTGRNAPSVVNAAYNFRSFWDGRASNVFNGATPFGANDPEAFVYKSTSSLAAPQKEFPRIPFSSLASQAVGPPGSPVEMSCDGRLFRDMGRKMLTVVPLGEQEVAPDDSVLSPYSKKSDGRRGLNTSYAEMIKKAFKPEWWNSTQLIDIDANAPENTNLGFSDIFKLREDGKIIKPVRKGDIKRLISANHKYTQMEANFSLYWGLAIQLYEQTLIADNSKVDQFYDGNTGALDSDEQAGMAIFMGPGKCINCHGGAETTNASMRKVTNERLERMLTGNGAVGVYDDGFYNIGVRPTKEDVGVGGMIPGTSLPLSETLACQQKLSTCEPSVLNIAARADESIASALLDPNERTVVNGAFKVPGLRNVELTGPYFHNGGQATLRQVVDFYDRGGDFANQNIADLDPDIGPIGLSDTQKTQLVKFLVAFTDQRVKLEQAPFDHPALCIPNGERGDSTSVKPDSAQKTQARDEMQCLPAVGGGGRPAAAALQRFMNLDPQTP